MTSTASKAATELLKFYATVFCLRDAPLCATTQLKPPVETLDGVIVDESSMLTALLNLDSSKSPGADEITPRMLKHCAYSLSIPITKLFNHSLNCGQVPVDWKCGIITPIFKGGNRSEAVNYRPVTLLPTISKVLEKLVARKLVDHLEKHDLISASQHGFRRRHSCLSNLLLALDDWTRAVDGGETVHACYLDMSKAFDRVDHNILLRKLKEHGIGGKILTWLANYLTDRTVRVRVDGALSDPAAVTSGVPQGSVLGPILFLLYVNDIPELMHCDTAMFADDIKP